MTVRRIKTRAGLALLLLGLLLVLAAAGLAGAYLHEARTAALDSAETLAALRRQTPETRPARRRPVPAFISPDAPQTPLYLLDPALPAPTVELDGRQYIGTVEVPALGEAAPVLGEAAPVLGEYSISGLKSAACRWSGSLSEGDLVLCAHNYLKPFDALKTLLPGDAVRFTDADGNGFSFRVAAVETLEAWETEAMECSGYPLTLYTCTVGGQYRVTVRCIAEGEV